VVYAAWVWVSFVNNDIVICTLLVRHARNVRWWNIIGKMLICFDSTLQGLIAVNAWMTKWMGGCSPSKFWEMHNNNSNAMLYLVRIFNAHLAPIYCIALHFVGLQILIYVVKTITIQHQQPAIKCIFGGKGLHSYYKQVYV